MIHFYKTPSLLTRISNHLIWNIPTEDKNIYLTFDDGPIPQLTEYVLEILDEYNAKATFFCVGENISKHPEICHKVIDHGHKLGNHTYNHLKGWRTKNDEYFTNVDQCQSQLSIYQQSSTKALFRPPYGQISKSQIKPLSKNYHIIMWDVLAYDFDSSHSPEVSLNNLIKKTRPGSIVVFHDNYKAEEKLKFMLPRYLDHFKQKDFNFKKIELN